MKVSLNWVKEFVAIDAGIDEVVDKIGKQIGAVEEVIDLGAKYKGIIIARVVSCEKHLNADRLNVCKIDDRGVAQHVERDENGFVQVVCGAPNVRAGLSVAWLPPGSTVPTSYDDDPFVLSARELRGVVSNGMLASGKELAINDDHAGILELNIKEEFIGKDFAETYGLNDYIIDIENKMFTHRPDCFGILGVAREIAGIFETTSSDATFYGQRTTGAHESDEHRLHIENQLPELVPRFMAQLYDNIVVKPSSVSIQARLMSMGIRPINNIVDITNYMMHLTGQPLHAYDYDKVVALSGDEGAKLVIRHPQEGETITLLNGKELTPRADAIMIATDKALIGLGGVMGGVSTEVDESTKTIILECANFNMYNIRRTSMEHGLFTDAVTRFNKGQSPLQNEFIMRAAQEMLLDESASPGRSIYDLKHTVPDLAQISLEAGFINNRLGSEFTADAVAIILQRVGFEVSVSGQQLTITAPLWRTDIAIKEDIVEEVGRLYDFGKLPQALPVRLASPTPVDASLALKQRLRKALASFGANEVLTYSFVHSNLLEKAGQSTEFAFKLTNALSPDLQYYRMSLTPSLLAQVHPNIKAGHDSFSMFEINKTHITLHKDDDAGLPKELGMVTLVTADKSRTDAAYYQARTYLDALAANLGVTLVYKPITEPMDYQITMPFEHTRSALVSVAGTDIFVGMIGEYKTAVGKAFKLPQFCAGFELDMEGLLQITEQKRYAPLSRYPSIAQDICLEVDTTLSYAALTTPLDEQLHTDLALDQVISLEPIDLYQADNSDKKRITYRVTLTSYERTLSDSVLSPILDRAATQLHESCGAVRI